MSDDIGARIKKAEREGRCAFCDKITEAFPQCTSGDSARGARLVLNESLELAAPNCPRLNRPESRRYDDADDDTGASDIASPCMKP